MECAKAFLVERGHQVAETLVERGYQPDEEVQKHVAADLVILQTPVNWFGAPWNAPRETFDNPASYLYGGKDVADLFLPIMSNYKFCGYEILRAFGVFDIYKNPDIPRSLEEYRHHLEKYVLTNDLTEGGATAGRFLTAWPLRSLSK